MQPIRLSLLTLCTALALSGPSAAALDEVEEQLQATIEARRGEALDLLAASVNLNSGTFNSRGVREVGQLFREEFDALGFATRWVDGTPFGRGGHLVATHGNAGPHFLLIGHLDTVFEPDSPFQAYEPIDERYARGPGTTDMKGGNVIILEVMHALEAAGVLDRMTFTVILTGDEERIGHPIELSRADLLAAADAADYALGFEDGDGDPSTAVIARRGACGWEMTVEGTPAHSSQVFSESIGYGAIFEAARILDRFRTELAGEDLLTFNPGLFLGGTQVEADLQNSTGTASGKGNIVAASTVVSGDLRTISPEQLAAAQERMEAIVADHLPGTSASIRFRCNYPPLAPTEGNLALLAAYDEASRDLGFGPVEAVDPRRAGAADISFCAGRVEGAMCGLGLMGTGGHTLDETADLDTLTSQAMRAAVLIWRLSQR